MAAKKEKYEQTSLVEDDEIQQKLSRARQAQPSLVLIAGKPLGKRFPILPPEAVIGRSSDSDVRVDVSHLSRKHAAIKIEGTTVTIEDLGSTNGTFVNDKKIAGSVVLKEGDHIRCGKTIFKYVPRGSIESLYHEDIHGMAHVDDMTQVYNKMYLLDCLRVEFTRSKNIEAELSIIMIDLDHFKQVNDEHGHLAGDYVLREACAVIKKKVLRGEDLIGRYGGEEFLIVLADTPLKLASEIAERLRVAIEKHKFTHEGEDLPITISLGVATLDKKDSDPVRLIKRADEALYKAKNSGRNRVCT